MKRKPADNPTAAIALIGDELLSGKVSDQNGAYLITELRELGVALKEIRVISDDIEAIAICLRGLSDAHDYLFTSGGVGPTHDDNTLAGVAKAFGVALVDNATMAHHIDTIFANKPEKRKAFGKMARVPEGTMLLQSAESLWPVYQFKNVYILPGIPEIFRRQFETIRERFHSDPFHLRTIYYRLDEGSLAPKISQVCKRFPGVSFGSYPVLGSPDYRVRVTIESKQRTTVESAYDWLIEQFGREVIFKIVDGSY